MDWEDESQEQVEQDQRGPAMPGTSVQDPRTYDPTQGVGSDAWQMSTRASMERNARERRN